MAALFLLFASAILGVAAPGAVRIAVDRASPPASYLPGRAEDARVARVAWRLATAARERCPRLEPASGLVLQHLSQFRLGDRAGIVARLPLDRGPGVIAVVPGGPADGAGIRAGDVLLAIDGAGLPPEPDLAAPFDGTRARARADAVADLLQVPRDVTLLRGGDELTLRLAPRPACPSRVHLARSDQRNAFADGRHVLLTTGMLGDLRGDDELAFLIAHEMAHNVLGHAAVMRAAKPARRAVRALESAADRLGAEMMLDAGYDPVAGAQLLARVGGADFGADFGIALFARHEPVATRLAAIRALAGARGPR